MKKLYLLIFLFLYFNPFDILASDKTEFIKIVRLYEHSRETPQYVSDIGYHYIKLDKIDDHISMSNIMPIKSFMIRRALGSYNFDMHTAPRIQYIYIIDAPVDIRYGTRVEIEKNLYNQRFKKGKLFLVEDIEGAGHKSIAVNNEPRTSIFIPIPVELQRKKSTEKATIYDLDNYEEYKPENNKYSSVKIEEDKVPAEFNVKLKDRGTIGQLSDPIPCDGLVVGRNDRKIFLIFLFKKEK